MSFIKRIEVFGDSILKGIQINPNNKRFHVDNHIDIDGISDKHLVSIENYSKFGCTITKGQASLYRHLEKAPPCDAVVMDFGGNDCDFNWKEIGERPLEDHQPHTPLDRFVPIYHDIISTLRAKNVLPILTTLPPLEPQRFFDWYCKDFQGDNIMIWLGTIQTIYRYQEYYSRTVESIARKADVPLVDLRGAFLAHKRVDLLLCEDGTHPNTDGQKVISSAFREFADRLAIARREGCPIGYAWSCI